MGFRGALPGAGASSKQTAGGDVPRTVGPVRSPVLCRVRGGGVWFCARLRIRWDGDVFEIRRGRTRRFARAEIADVVRVHLEAGRRYSYACAVARRPDGSYLFRWGLDSPTSEAVLGLLRADGVPVATDVVSLEPIAVRSWIPGFPTWAVEHRRRVTALGFLVLVGYGVVSILGFWVILRSV
jgi:hypothetical protein